ncbi:MAG: glutamyl-tRNA reductase [Legionellaceae bacterium]|nr:glutamyl-tRNA reductase [Legionellaceae bacterium]
MVFVACGLNHKTAPLSVRERVALLPTQQVPLLENLMDLPDVHEAALLSTCNRTEIYCDTSEPAQIGKWLAFEHNIPEHELRPFLYMHHNEAGIRHTLRVASGLDSMMLGEPQILGQLKQAYQQACQLGSVQSTLRGVFEYVFSASKRIRNLSGIGTNPVSVAYAAVQLIAQRLPDFHRLNVLLIGAGETSSLVAKYLQQAGVQQFTVASRTLESAQKLAANFAGKTANIGDIPAILHQADVIITATACPLPFINRSLMQNALNQRQMRPMFLLDLAVPRDIEANVATLPQIHLFNIDDLQQLIEKGMDDRRNRAQEAEQLIEAELDNYIRWHRSLRADEVICEYRQRMQSLAAEETQRALQKLARGHAQEQVLHELSQRLVNKLTHRTTVGLRHMARDGQHELLELAQYFFNHSYHDRKHEEIS